MLQLHQLLEHRVTENTACMLCLIAWQWGLGLVEVHIKQGSFTSIAGVSRHPYAVGILEAVSHHITLVAGHLPLGP